MALNRRQGLAVGVGLAVFSLFSAPSSARAQISPDPYKPYNSQYEQYIYPSYPSDLSVPSNQTSLQARGGAGRSFQRYLEAEDEMDRAASSSSVSPQRRGIGVPYYSAYRADQTYNREYTPNKEADKRYLQSRQTRDEIYSQYLAERDPKKKAQLLKEYQDYNLRALRDLNDRRSTAARRPTTRNSETAGNSDAVPPRPPIPGTVGRRPERPAASAPDAERPASARPSSTDILRRSETQDRPAPTRRPTPPPPPRRAGPETDVTP